MRETMTWRVHGTTLILRHVARAPSGSEWAGFCADLGATSVDRLLVWAPGGAAPNASQRAMVIEVFKDKPDCRTAVLSDSRLTRGAAVAIAWFVPRIRAFDEADISGATRFLELGAVEARAVIETLAQLADELPSD